MVTDEEVWMYTDKKTITDKKKIFCSILLLLLSSIGSATAEDINFEVTVDKARVSVGESIQLSLTFYGTQVVPTPYFPGVDGFDWRYLGPSKMTSIINNQVSTSITHRYRLISLREGTFEIPSFSVQFRGKTYTSKPISVEVVRGPVSPPQAGQGPTLEDKISSLKERVFLIIQVDKRKAYVNEIIPVTFKLFVNNLALRDIQYPQISHKGFSVEEFAEPKQYQEVLRGVLHNVIEFKTNVFATRTGELKLGPAQLQCNLLIKEKSGRRSGSSFFDDFFDDDSFGDNLFARYRTHPLTLESIDIPITIVALPEMSKPDDFSGAIGNYKFSLSVDPKKVKVGDPITLTMNVFGEGNLKTVNPPGINLQDGFKVYDPDVKQDKENKTFEQVIIPKNDRIDEIPEISFSFFNPESGEYKKITKGPIAITVNPLPKGEELKVFEIAKEDEGIFRRKEILGRNIIYIKDTPGKLKRKGTLLCKNKPFIALQFVPLFAIIAILIFQRRRERLETDIGYARRLRAPAKARKNLLMVKRLLQSQKSGEFFDAVFKTLQEYLGDKFQLPIAGITANVIDELRLRNIDQDVLNKIAACFTSCDMARYAPSSITEDKILKTFNLLEEIIEKLERTKV